jgi:glucokinase
VSVHRDTVLYAGVDIGGTNTRVGFVSENGTIVVDTAFETMAHDPVEGFVRRLASAVQEMCGAFPSRTVVRGVGVAAPAANPRTGGLEDPANFAWGNVPLVALLEDALELPVSLLNDGDAAVLGEVRYGVARGMRDVVVITLGTGLGAGIMVNGALLQGAHGAAGEVGHTTLVPGGRMCGCGQRGCAEAYVSAPGLIRTTLELLAERHETSALRDVPSQDLQAHIIAHHAAKGDPVALAALTATGTHLGRVLVNVIQVFDPEAVVLCGGLVKAGAPLIDHAFSTVHEIVPARYGEKVRLLVSSLNSGEAAILGATSAMRDSRLRPNGIAARAGNE